ncbi:hypothetical protein OPV22_033478 [Ensete ventricosum]|uniref:SAM domain-containing protein n=3 Tax=Musaceae TaxID=4637 RepID=A0AAV8PYE6_ENSVE|nr:hypothetical protein OPV22_033478 [Ensete ventricosum]
MSSCRKVGIFLPKATTFLVVGHCDGLDVMIRNDADALIIIKEADSSDRLVASNALMIISGLVYYLRPVTQAGAILLEENAVMVSEEMVRILEADAKKAKAAASYVLWDLSSYLIQAIVFAARREASALELYKLESGRPKSNWQLISDIKRRTDTTGLGEEDMLCIMSGPDEDADGSEGISFKYMTVHELTRIQQSVLLLAETPWSAVGAAFMINSITTTRNIKDSKNDSVHLQLLVGGPGCGLVRFQDFETGFFARKRAMSKGRSPEPLDFFIWTVEDVGLWLEEINLGSYRQVFEENGVNGEYLESLSMFTTEQILRFIRRCHMKWGDFITLCKELRRIKVACLKGEQEVRKPWWAPSCLSVVFVRVAKRNRQSRVVSLKLEPL